MPKPSFDPSQPFQKSGAKPAFDASQPFDKGDSAPPQAALDALLGKNYKPSTTEATDSIDPNAAPPAQEPVSGAEKALRYGESFANGYSSGITKPAFAMSAAAGQMAHNAVAGDDDHSVMDADKPALQDFAEKTQDMSDRQKQFEGENPWTSGAANVAGALSPGSVANRVLGGIGKGVGAVSGAVSKGAQSVGGLPAKVAQNGLAKWLGGVAADSATGAGTGAATTGIAGASNTLADGNASLSQTGDDMKTAAKIGAFIPAAANVVKGGSMLGGRLVSKMSPKAAQTLADDTTRVDDYYNKMKGANSDPQAVHNEMSGLAKDASSKLNDVQDGLNTQYKQGLSGKNIRVNSSQLSDTGIPQVDAELARIKGLPGPPQGKTISVPVEELPPSNPADAYKQKINGLMEKGTPMVPRDNQAATRGAVNAGMNGLPGAAEDVNSPGGFVNKMRDMSQGTDNAPTSQPALRQKPYGNTYEPLPPTEAPAPQQAQLPPEGPDSHTLTGEQAHNLARTTQANTRFADQGIHGATAVGNGKALGAALKEGLHAVGGEGEGSLSDLDAKMGQNAKLGRVFRKMTGNDPTQGIGAQQIGKQAVLQKIDDVAGTDLYGANKALTSAKAFKPGITPAIGRQVLRMSGGATRANLGDNSLSAILRLFGNNAGEDNK